MFVNKIISGGQTGVDRAALDVAIVLDIPHGGTVPKGRLARDGPLAPRYRVLENDSADPADRTRQNVVDADATLILHRGSIEGGTKLTREVAVELHKPVVTVALASIPTATQRITEWLLDLDLPEGTLNVAGPREDEEPGIQALAAVVLHTAFAGSSDTDVTALLVGMREQTLSQVHHWDQVRWLVPSWYTTIGAGVITLLTSVPEARTAEAYIAAGASFGIVGLVCSRLMWNLQVYHEGLVQDYHRRLRQLTQSRRLIEIGNVQQPYRFTGREYWKTATAWLFATVVLLTALSFSIFAIGLYRA